MQKLKIDNDFYTEDLTLFGLVSDLPAYRLAFVLNDNLDLQLKRSEHDKKFNYKNNELFYPSFNFEDPKKDIEWILISNKNPIIKEKNEDSSSDQDTSTRIVSGLPLLPNLKIMDFFLGYYGEENNITNQRVKVQLKELSYVSTFQQINLLKTKNIENLLID